MTNQEKKRLLRRYRAASAEIDDLLRERESWRERGLALTAKLSDMPRGGGVSDKTGDAATRVADIDALIIRRTQELAVLREDIGRIIGTVRDDTLRRILYLRYIEGCTWEAIAERMQYSYQWVCILHGRALEAIRIDRPL